MLQTKQLNRDGIAREREKYNKKHNNSEKKVEIKIKQCEIQTKYSDAK